jgi:hypothetical protein
MDADGRLGIYLNDHLAVHVLAGALAARMVAHNRGSELGAFLAAYRPESVRERQMLLAAMRRVGAGRQPYKEFAARMAERLGRLKPNGQLRGYSPLSRLLEIETLLGLLRASRSVWTTLEALADPRLSGMELQERVVRSTANARELERIGMELAPGVLRDPRRRPPEAP